METPLGWNDVLIHHILCLCNFFPVVLVAFCGASYLEVVKSRDDQVPTKTDFLAAFLPLVCIPAILSLCSGLHKWWVTTLHVIVVYQLGFPVQIKQARCSGIFHNFRPIALWLLGHLLMSYGIYCRKDDDWRLSRGVSVFISIGLLLLLCAISAIIFVVKPWTVRITLVFAVNFSFKL